MDYKNNKQINELYDKLFALDENPNAEWWEYQELREQIEALKTDEEKAIEAKSQAEHDKQTLNAAFSSEFNNQ